MVSVHDNYICVHSDITVNADTVAQALPRPYATAMSMMLEYGAVGYCRTYQYCCPCHIHTNYLRLCKPRELM